MCKPTRKPSRYGSFFLALCDIFPIEPNECEKRAMDRSTTLFNWAEKLTESKSKANKRILRIAADLATGKLNLIAVNELCRLYSTAITIIINEFIIDFNQASDKHHVLEWKDGKYLELDEVNKEEYLPISPKGKLYSIGIYKHEQLMKASKYYCLPGKPKKGDIYKILQERLSAVQKLHPYLFT